MPKIFGADKAPRTLRRTFSQRTARQATATGATPRGYNPERLGWLRSCEIRNRLNKTIRDAGIEDQTTYCLRHSMVEAMRVSEAREDLQRRLIGHAGAGTKDRVYGGKANLSDMSAAITKALDHLGVFDDDGC